MVIEQNVKSGVQELTTRVAWQRVTVAKNAAAQNSLFIAGQKVAGSIAHVLPFGKVWMRIAAIQTVGKGA